jgi:hypothetical protein
MTSFKARLEGKTPQTNNIKDGPKRPRDRGDQWLAAGFTWPGPQRAVYNYTWDGNFPLFRIGPERLDGCSGLVARCARVDVVLFFAYGTSPAIIAGRLDDEILSIMRHDAEIAEMPINWEPREIGAEIDIDDWMTRPLAAARQSTPAADKLANEHGISRELAGEILIERGS